MLFRISFGIFLLLIILTCASTKNDFDIAKSKNTINAYEEFIKKHPNGEYTDIAKNEILELTKKEEMRREEAKKNRIKSLAIIERYTVGTTTEDMFFTDGWNIDDVESNKIGIIFFNSNSDSTFIFLGYTDKNINTGQSQDALDFYLRSRRAGMKSKSRIELPLNNSVQQVCLLQFKKGILSNLKWAKSFKK